MNTNLLLRLLEHDEINNYICENVEYSLDVIKNNFNKDVLYSYVESNITNLIDNDSIDNTYSNIKFFTIKYILENAEVASGVANVGIDGSEGLVELTGYAVAAYYVKSVYDKFINNPQDEAIKEIYDTLTGGSFFNKYSGHWKLKPGLDYQDFVRTFVKVRDTGDFSEFFKIMKLKEIGVWNYYSSKELPKDLVEKATNYYNNMFDTKFKDLDELVRSKQYLWWMKKYNLPRMPRPVLWDELPDRVIPTGFKQKVSDYFSGTLYNTKKVFKYGVSHPATAVKEFGKNLLYNSGRFLKEITLTGIKTLYTPTTIKGMFAITAIAGFTKLISLINFDKFKKDSIDMISSVSEDNKLKIEETVKNSEVVDVINQHDNSNSTYIDDQFNKIVSGEPNNIVPTMPITIEPAEISIDNESGLWSRAREIASQYGGTYGITILVLTISGILLYRVIGSKLYEKKFK